jgi:hypothetical protein
LASIISLNFVLISSYADDFVILIGSISDFLFIRELICWLLFIFDSVYNIDLWVYVINKVILLNFAACINLRIPMWR